MAKKSKKESEGGGFGEDVGGFLGGLANLIEKLGELADKGEELSRHGEISGSGRSGQLKGVYGFNVKVGLGQDQDKIRVEPFGNIKRDARTGETVVQEVREPMVDLFEEDDHILIVAEMPGIGTDDVRLHVKDDVLTITGEKGDKKFRKEVLLPGHFSRKNMKFSCNNGMLEIRCTK
ncbi:MAG: Hsp20/alpha crystallin family protein [Thermodesulfobacteriota bacterium]